MGNSSLPLLKENPGLFFYSFDFSQKALQILIDRSREEKVEDRISVFHWDPAVSELPCKYDYHGHLSLLPKEGAGSVLW